MNISISDPDSLRIIFLKTFVNFDGFIHETLNSVHGHLPTEEMGNVTFHFNNE